MRIASWLDSQQGASILLLRGRSSKTRFGLAGCGSNEPAGQANPRSSQRSPTGRQLTAPAGPRGASIVCQHESIIRHRLFRDPIGAEIRLTVFSSLAPEFTPDLRITEKFRHRGSKGA